MVPQTRPQEVNSNISNTHPSFKEFSKFDSKMGECTEDFLIYKVLSTSSDMQQ